MMAKHLSFDSALQAHFFKKLPFGDLQLQNSSHKKNSVAKNKKREGEDTSWHITRHEKNFKGEDTSWRIIRSAVHRTAHFQHFFCCRKFMHSCRVSEWREGKRERQVMLPLVLLIKSVLLLIIFHISFSFNLLVANWPLSPEFWSPKLFFTRHGD